MESVGLTELFGAVDSPAEREVLRNATRIVEDRIE
jgi:hypothetical protein